MRVREVTASFTFGVGMIEACKLDWGGVRRVIVVIDADGDIWAVLISIRVGGI